MVQKQAKVIPIHTKKGKYLAGNYRPISLLSIFGKPFEKTMHIWLYSFITKYRILYDLQFGFRNNLSTTLAIIDIVERIRGTLDKGEKALGIYLNLQKAFDTVDHHILIQKLSHYGIRSKCLSWFSSYLSGRSQFVYVNNAQSECKSINIGVPHGSVLRPVIFLLYLNDIANFMINTGITIVLFADDTNIFIHAKNITDLILSAETLLKTSSGWLKDNRLSLNIEKTEYSIFHNNQTQIPDNCNHLTFDNITIKRVATAKYLGIIMDDKLIWESHIKYIIDQLVRYTGIFKLISKLVPTKKDSLDPFKALK